MQVRKRVSSPATTLLVTFVLGAAIGLSLGYAFFGETGRGTRPVAPPSETARVEKTAQPTEPVSPPPASTETQPKETPATPPSPETTPAVQETPSPAETANKPTETTSSPEVPETPMTFSPGAHLFITLGDAGLDDAMCALIQEVQPSGIVLRGDVLTDASKTLELVARLHQAMGQPIAMDAWPLIVAEQEGGDLNPFGLTPAPSASELGAALSLDHAHTTAKCYAEAALARGIGILLAPVMNIEEEDTPGDPMWSKRLFGSSQGLVSKFGIEFIKGITETNAIAVARTYPGIGRLNKKNPHALRSMRYFTDDEQDSTRVAEVVFPFQEAAFNKVPGVLVGHVSVPVIDADQPKRSAAFSPPLVKLILRDQFKFEGVILADDLTSGPISKIVPPEQGVVKALAAGCDAVLFLDPDPRRIRAAVKEIQNAVDTKKLDKDVLVKSRERLNLWRKQLAKTNVKFPEHPATSPAVASPAPVTEVKPVEVPTPAPEVKPAETPAPAPAPETKASAPAVPTPTPEVKSPEPPVPVPAPEVKTPVPTPATETKPAETPAPAPSPEVKPVDPPAPNPAPAVKPAETPAPAPAPETKAAEPSASTPKPEVKPAETPAPAPAPETKVAAVPATPPTPDVKPAEAKSTETPVPNPTPEAKPADMPASPATDTATVVAGERPPNTRRITYTVKDNDTLTKISAKYKVAENDILTWSKRSADEIKPGKKLTIYVKKKAEDSKAGTETSKETKDAETAKDKEKEPVKKVPTAPTALPENTELYTITEGDKLSKIAISRNTTIQKLMELNKLESADKIVLGQGLIVPKMP